jgi:hypothetical protein
MRFTTQLMLIGMLISSVHSFSNSIFKKDADLTDLRMLNRFSNQPADTPVKAVDTLLKIRQGKKSVNADLKLQSSRLNPAQVLAYPAVTLQQYLKGQAAGLYIQEPSSEPGSLQNMLIHGAAMPLLSAREQFQSQPLVVLDGIPLVGEHPFAFDIQQYKFNRIGPATNLLGNIDMENIASIEVLNDIAGTAVYGPRAINGVIILTSKTPDRADQVAFNSWVGLAVRPQVTTNNVKY